MRVLVTVLIFVFHSHIAAQDPRASGIEDFARVVYMPGTSSAPAKWLIQTSIRQLTNSDENVRITLIAMHHIGELGYFKAIEAELGAFDSTVFEGWNDFDASTLHVGFDWLKRFQRVSAKLLDLGLQSNWERQLKHIQIVRIDLPKERMKEEVDRLGGPAFSKEMMAYIEQLEAFDPSKADAIKAASVRSALGRVFLTDIRNYSKVEGTDPLAQLNAVRDQFIFDSIKDCLTRTKAKKIALVYGAAHAWKLEQRLVKELGYKHVCTSWRDAQGVVEAPASKEKQDEK